MLYLSKNLTDLSIFTKTLLKIRILRPGITNFNSRVDSPNKNDGIDTIYHFMRNHTTTTHWQRATMKAKLCSHVLTTK